MPFEHPLKNAYIGDVREPTANTILYCPLRTDLLDHWPNNISLSQSSTISLDENWAKFNNASLGGVCPSIISGNFTFSMWFNATSAWTDCNLITIWAGYPWKGYRYWANSSGKIWFTLTSVIDRNYGTAFSTLYWAWHNMIMTRSWTTNTLYLDGVSKWTYSWTSLPSNAQVSIGGRNTWGMNWNMNYAIIESVARTATEVAEYYNLTKWKYWL